MTGLPDVRPGDDLAALIATWATDLRDGDVVVVTQKVVSKAEGRLVTTPTDDAWESLRRAPYLVVPCFVGDGCTPVATLADGVRNGRCSSCRPGRESRTCCWR